MKRVLSGIQSSGNLHLGNYFGMLSRMIKYQEKNDLFTFIANYHTMTTIQNRSELQKNTLSAATDFIALGLNPEKSTFWIQSDVPQVTELTWFLANITGVGMLERATAYKDKISKGLASSMGLFSYPLLMAADILLFGGELVPVGKDQKQHLEISRDIALRFNKIYGNVFKIPRADLDINNQIVRGIDGQKMSKSYGNTIPIFAPEKLIKKQIMSIVTDSTAVNQAKNIDNPLYQIYSLFLNEQETALLKDRFLTPGLRYGDVKKELYGKVMEHFGHFREKRQDLEKNQDYIIQVLKNGAEKAGQVGREYLAKARAAAGLNYWE
ncbi:MAG: tryptophan--tRNA ligase [Candidatus Neomarinimicrobiota bacterium]